MTFISASSAPFYSIGQRVALADGRSARITEIVPAGRLPRSVPRAAAPRPHQSFVVTVLAVCTVPVRRHAGPAQSSSLQRSASLGCRRLWPQLSEIRPLQASAPRDARDLVLYQRSIPALSPAEFAWRAPNVSVRDRMQPRS